MTDRIRPSGARRVSSLRDMDPDEDRVLFTVCRAAAEAAIAQVASCEPCNEDADWPFEAILDRVMGIQRSPHGYFMAELRVCKRCKATVTEKTLVP